MAAGGSSDNTEGPCLWARAANQAILTQNRSILPFPSPAWHLVPDATLSLLALAALVYRNTLIEARTLTPVPRRRETASHHLLCPCFQEARRAAGSPAVGRCRLSTSVLRLLCRAAAGSPRGRDFQKLDFPPSVLCASGRQLPSARLLSNLVPPDSCWGRAVSGNKTFWGSLCPRNKTEDEPVPPNEMCAHVHVCVCACEYVHL